MKFNSDLSKAMKGDIKADMLIIPAIQDHAVNPIVSIQIAKELDAQLVT